MANWSSPARTPWNSDGKPWGKKRLPRRGERPRPRARLARRRLHTGKATSRHRASRGHAHGHPGVSVPTLARGYSAAGKLDLVLPIFEESLKFKTARLGPDHPQTLSSLS